MPRLLSSLLVLALLTGLLVVAPPAPQAEAATINGIGTVYAGIYSEHFDAGADLDALAGATGKRMTFAGTFHSVNENDGVAGGWSNTREMLDHVWAGQATPFANLTIPASAASIASGAWDGKINEWASHLEQFLNKGGGRSLVLAPLQEMNGTWTPYGCDPANFVNAYRRVVDIIRGRGIDETKVRFAFAPNGWTDPKCGSIGSYYPGNGYVDVIGISAYRWSDCANVFSVLGATVNEVSGAFPGKPIIIAQTGSFPCADKDAWIREMFAWAASHHSVVGIVYFNLNQSSVAGETDWRVWINPTVNAGFRDGVRAGGTTYQWPLRDWFQPGPLNLSLNSGVTLCVGQADCDTAAFQDLAGGFHIWDKATSGVIAQSFLYGNPGDVPFSGDWDCDGVETPGLYRQSDGYVYLRNSNSTGVADIAFFFGNPGDFPLAGDFNHDGCDTVSIHRPSEQRFYVINTLGSNDGGLGAADYSFLFGNPGDKPFVGDFDGDGFDTVGLHRESTGLVYFRNSNSTGTADSQFIYGDPGDKLIAGDWDGDGDDTIGVYRPSNGIFYLRNSNTQGGADAWAFAGSYTGLASLNP
ncbi:MAG TPA: glycosyl hydrolase [Acidimicrobiia bacterium]|nr:glycosyl hydrolase [Acidimicrobiia bacterium]